MDVKTTMISKCTTFLALIILSLPLSFSASAQGNQLPIILELFTAESCPYCPQADALMAEYTKLPRVIGYSCHVARTHSDLSFAHDFCSRRQEYYQRTIGFKGRYTPQMVVNGVVEVTGYRQDKITAAAKKSLKHMGKIKIREASPDLFVLDMPAAVSADYMLVVVQIAKPKAASKRFSAGGNRTYHNLATQFSDTMKWQGERGPLHMRMGKEQGGKGFIVLAQKISTGKIVAAGQYNF